MSDAFLQQIGASGRAVLEQLERVVRAHVLADDEDPDLGMSLPQSRRRLDAFVRARRRHPDVRDHDVRPVPLDGIQERLEIGAVLQNLDFVLPLERAPDSLADEVGILRDDQPVDLFLRGLRCGRHCYAPHPSPRL